MPNTGVTMSRVDAVPAPTFPERFGVRIFLYIVTLSLGTSFSTTGIYYWRQRAFIEHDRSVRAHTLLGNLATQSELGAYAADPALCELPARRTFDETDVAFVAVYDRRGHEILGFSRPDQVPRPPSPEVFQRLEVALEDLPATFKGPQRSDDTYDDLYAPIVTLTRDPADALAGGMETRREVVGLARLGLSLRPARQQLDEVLRWGLILGAAILIVGIAAALLISRKVSRPISALIEGADQLRHGELDARVHIASRDELGQLAYSFNRMAGRLNESITALENQSRNLEAEVDRRTAEVQRAADFAALLNAPLGRHDAALVPLDPREAADAPHPVARLLDQVLEVMLAGTGARAVGVYLEPDENEATASLDLRLERCIGADPDTFAPPPPIELLEDGVTFIDGDRTVAPMLLGAEVIGFVSFVGMQPSDDLLRFASQAAMQLAVAVGNVRAYGAADRLAKALKERNVALARQRDQLREMNRLKSEFLANVSHELRTPLNAIIGYCELITEGLYGDVNDGQKQALSGIDESGKNLLQLINEILDLAKVESGKMAVYLEATDVVEVARAVVAETAPLAKDRPYHVRLHAAGKVEVRTDAAKVKQILTNLVSNAIKFTKQGSVDVTVETLSDGGCAIAVRDTGIGIKAQNLGIIFEEFRQVDGSYTREFGGTGLGLAIAKRFAHMLGGQVNVTSVVGKGSTFAVRLPARAPEAAAAPPPAPLLPAGRTAAPGAAAAAAPPAPAPAAVAAPAAAAPPAAALAAAANLRTRPRPAPAGPLIREVKRS